MRGLFVRLEFEKELFKEIVVFQLNQLFGAYWGHEALLTTSLQSPALCNLRSEMCILVIVSNVCNSKGSKELPGKAYRCGLYKCKDM